MRVVPISLMTKEGQFYYLLKSYKGYYSTQAQRIQLGSVLARFLGNHAACIRGQHAAWNTITIVPSSGEREGPHPLEDVARGVAKLLSQQYELLLRKREQLRHNAASDAGYEPIVEVTDRRVLLLDDTFTTGARVQSAASALQLAGARVVAAVIGGRLINLNPAYPQYQALWDRAGAEAFDFRTCCLCGV
jgi:hypothetical protein